MTYRPNIAWSLARGLARQFSGPLPETSRADAVRLTADLRVTAKRAGEMVFAFLGLPGAGAATVRVVDWDSWAKAIEAMTETLTAELPVRGSALSRRIRGIGSAAVVGAVLGKVSGRLLGQYDGLTGDVLYLLAPTIVDHERRLGLIPADFRLWVALHEQAHAAQFQRAVWLRGFLLGQLAILIDDDASLIEGLRGWANTRDLTSFATSRAARGTLTSVVAAMTFLEGHADYVADAAGKPHIGSIRALRRTFERGNKPNLLSRVAGVLDKSAQYRDGLAFCRGVAAEHGHDALDAAFGSPAALPTAEELITPHAWIERVHG